MAAQKAKGRTDVVVRMANGPEDPGATGLRLAAIQSMTRKVPLFSLVMVSPGSEDGSSIWSFVWAEGSFQWVGKMARFNPTRGDMVADILCSLPLRAAEERLRKEGSLEMPAVDCLKKVGVLR